MDTGAIPGELKSINQWCVWRRELTARGTPTKPPYDAKTGERAYNTVPETWAPFWRSVQVYERLGIYSLPHLEPFDGIAIAITSDLGIVGVDLDHVSEWPDGAWSIVRALSSYTELSPSGDGYRIFCRGTKPEGRCRLERVEMFADRRIFSVTGRSLNIRPHLEARQAELEQVHHEWLGTEYARRRVSRVGR